MTANRAEIPCRLISFKINKSLFLQIVSYKSANYQITKIFQKPLDRVFYKLLKLNRLLFKNKKQEKSDLFFQKFISKFAL